jgi:hypothetical protein
VLCEKSQSVGLRSRELGYHMLKSLRVQNFRCFKEVDLPDLRRINVIVGKNATGKTALLEAVRLALGGTPGVLWALNQTRSAFFGVQQPLTKEIFESVWNQYFFDLDSSHPIFTECADSQGRVASLKIFYDSQKSVTAVPQQQQQPPNQPISTIAPLVFERTEFSGKTSTISASVNPQGGFVFDPGPELGIVVEFFPSMMANNPQQTAQWFSQLSVQKREKGIVDAVREEFEPALENLSVLALNNVPAVYANIRYLKERLPLSLLSAGINKFVGLLSAVLIRGGGVVLIDEIENGIFYQRLPSLWKYVLKFAIENDVQIFASTHSLECVRALGSAMQGREEDFTLLRSERTNGSSTISLLQGKFLEAAIEQGVEIR